jgi:hypothetical protein
MIKGGVYEAPLAVAGEPVVAGVKPVLKATGKALQPIAETVAETVAPAQEAFQRLKNKPTVTIEGANYQPELNTQMIGGGAALTSNAEAVKNALYQSNPEFIANLIKGTGVKSFDELPFDKLPLDVIERHNKFYKFDMTPTEGEALQDIKKMSIETNERTKDDLIRQRLEERDPKLIAAFNKIRDSVAPDVYESNPARLANAALEKLKQNYEARTAHENMLYKRLNDAGGGKFPVDGKQFANNALKVLIDDDRLEYLPSNIQKKLSDYASGTKQMNFNLFENLRTDLASEIRTANRNGEGIKVNVLGKVREELEKLPLSEESAHLKPLADEARNFFKEHKKLQENSPAYQAAINDTRTKAEILKGDLHPASNEFINKFYGPKTPQVEINRLLEELGIDSPEHQGLNASVIDKIKSASGVKGERGNETGRISQATLADQLNKIYGNNLPTMFKKEHIVDLKDLADVANMTEHVKGGHSVNVSNTALENERLAKQQLAEDLALNLGEGVVNLGTKGFGGTLARKLYEIKKGKSLQEAAEKEARIKSEKRVSPTAGISLEDIMNTGK